MFLILTALVVTFLVRRLLRAEKRDGGDDASGPPSQAASDSDRAGSCFLGFFVVFVLAPLYWMFITSIKPSDDYLAVPPVWFPAEPTIVHYTAALFAYRGLEGLINSLIVSTAATVLSALLGTLMAYSLARFNTGGQHLSFWVLSQRFLPPIAIVLPIFLHVPRRSASTTRISA